jgi:hypothetical protein
MKALKKSVKTGFARKQELTAEFEATAVVSKHLPNDVYEWMAATTVVRETPATTTTRNNLPLDMRTIATSCMVQASMASKRQASQPRI